MFLSIYELTLLHCFVHHGLTIFHINHSRGRLFSLLFSFNYRTNNECQPSCLTAEREDVCIFPYTFQNSSFNGCIQGSFVNRTLFNGSSDFVCPTQFDSQTGDYFNFQLCGDIGGTCEIQATPACFSDPCENGGTCQETGTNTPGYNCDCSTAANFLGLNCTLDDPCVPDPCNGEACQVTGNDAVGLAYQCDCSSGNDRIGQNCSADNPCVPDPCNGGNCSVSGNDAVGYSFSCDCTNVIDGIGETCSIDNPCVPNPCDKGTCEITGTNGDFSSNCICYNCSTVVGATTSTIETLPQNISESMPLTTTSFETLTDKESNEFNMLYVYIGCGVVAFLVIVIAVNTVFCFLLRRSQLATNHIEKR